ncbi:MAG: 2-phospho-L-lactate guanylyltransferase [Promethearchaeota archaeon]
MTETEIIAIIPIRFLPSTKNRLERSLDTSQRQRLVQAMLTDVIKAVEQSKLISRFVIVTQDKDFLASFSDPLFEIHRSVSQGLNEELTEYVTQLGQSQRGYALIILGDLPLLTGATLDELIWSGLQSKRPVIAKDWKGSGTNVLFFAYPLGFKLQFGEKSFQKHMKELQKNELNPIVYHSMATALDIDDGAAIRQLRILAQEDEVIREARTFQVLFVDEKRGGKVV